MQQEEQPKVAPVTLLICYVESPSTQFYMEFYWGQYGVGLIGQVLLIVSTIWHSWFSDCSTADESIVYTDYLAATSSKRCREYYHGSGGIL